MAESQSKSRTGLVVGVVVVAVMAFLGVLAGNWYLDYRRHHRLDQKVEGLAAGESTELRTGDVFPSVQLVDLAGVPVSTDDLVEKRPALVLFVSIGCDVCTDAVAEWTEALPALGSEVAVFGIADDEHEYVRVYAEKSAFPFPLYSDEADRFGTDYDVDVYPTIVGVEPGGEMSFVMHGPKRGFTLEKAMARLRGASGG